MVSDSAGKLVHIGASFQIGQPENDTLRLKSKPEASDAPNFIDTGKFHATSATLLGFEAYYRPGPWLFGTEYYWEKANSPETGDPLFHGGDIFANWLVTGETRSYNTVGGYFRQVSPTQDGVRGRAGRGGARAAVLLQRPRRRDAAGRNLLADHADGQLAPLR